MKRRFGIPVQNHKEGGITWVALKEPVYRGMDWEHLPRDQILGDNKRPAWVGRPKEYRLEGVHGAEKRNNQMLWATLSIIDNLVRDTTAAEVLAKLDEEGKKACMGTNNLLVWYTIAGRKFELPCKYKPVVLKKRASLGEEAARLWHKNAAL